MARKGTSGKKPAASPATAGAAPGARLSFIGPPGSLLEQVAKATLDRGYREVAVLIDNWETGCTCEGGTIPAAQVDAFAQTLQTQSLDPALKILAPALAALMGNCCAAVISPVQGDVNAAIKLLTLDPGAARLGSCIDAMHETCCEEAD